MGTLGQGVGAWGALTLELNLEDGEGRATSVMEQGCRVVLLSNRPRSKEGEFLGVLGLWWKPHSCFLAPTQVCGEGVLGRELGHFLSFYKLGQKQELNGVVSL